MGLVLIFQSSLPRQLQLARALIALLALMGIDSVFQTSRISPRAPISPT
jgi:hypothetical protein